jgi:hypothetical protein
MDAAVYATIGLLYIGLLSGLAFLAVHYNQTYHHVAGVLALISWVILTAMIAYSAGVEVAASAALPLVREEKVAAARDAVDGIQIGGVVDLAFFILAVALWALLFVSNRIDREKKEKEAARERRE